MEGERESLAYSVVGDGEDVGSSEAEDEEHFDGPAADAADCGEAGNDFFVGHAADACQGGYGSVDGFGGKVAQCKDFALGDAGGAELGLGRGEEMLGRGVVFTEGFEEALEDGGGCLAVKLLVDDGFEQGLKGRVLRFEAEGEGAGGVDEFCEARVCLSQLEAGEFGIVTYRAAAIVHGRSVEQDGCARIGIEWKFLR